MAKKEIGVEALIHAEAKRRNIPTAELEPVMEAEDKSPIRLAYERRNRDLDPQLVWRGKDEQDWSDLIVQAPPLYIQEKVHPKVLIDDLKRWSQSSLRGAAGDEAIQPGSPRRSVARDDGKGAQIDLFADFNGLPDAEAKTEFYQHDQNWSNRMILGDSLQVMASLAEREGLRGQVQCIYLDPPYGIKFNSNFQWSTTSRDVKDGAKDHVTREPEQVRAFRDTWRDGIHSYLTYLRDRLTVARDLLSDSGSIFVQIGDENVHRVRALMDEVFGEENCLAAIAFKKTTAQTSDFLPGVLDYVLHYSRNKAHAKFRRVFDLKQIGGAGTGEYQYVANGRLEVRRLTRDEIEAGQPAEGWRIFAPDNLSSQRPPGRFPVEYEGRLYSSGAGYWKTGEIQFPRLLKSWRVVPTGSTLKYRRYLSDFPVMPVANIWEDTSSGASRTDPKIYVVQTVSRVVERCILMTTDPGDLVLDPTCGSGTTAYVAEQWGRRWITIDTSRVALALARSRLMGARYPYYLLADSPEGQRKEAEVTRTAPKIAPTRGDIRHGFVYERVPHITLKSIANNSEIDVIWDKWQQTLEPLRAELNAALGRTDPPPFMGEGDHAQHGGGGAAPQPSLRAEGEAIQSGSPRRSAPRDDKAGWQEWEIPREAGADWPQAAKDAHTKWWQARIARQKEIDASIAAKAEFEYLYDKPYTDSGRIRVAGPFTVESLSPHRVLAVDAEDELIDLIEAGAGRRAAPEPSHEDADFAQMILDNLRSAGVQQAHKEDRITFTSLTGWPGEFICAEGRYVEGDTSAAGGKRDRAPAGQAAPAEAPAQPAAVSAKEKRAGIFIGPEFGTVSRPDLVAAAREAADAGFDVLVACAFNYDAHSAEFEKLGRIPVLKARMNPDLHMAGDLKNTGAGNLFVVFGEPDIEILDRDQDDIRVRVRGIDVFKPQTGEIESGGPDTIALWLIDTDYNEESFFVRHAYFLGANDPYKALKTTLKAEIDPEAWESLYSDTSRPFPKPQSGRIAVKVINHLGDEVMKVFRV